MRMLQETINAIGTLNETVMAAATARQNNLTKPAGSLGRLEAIGIQLAGITGTCPPPLPARRAVIVFAGDHGVVAQGVSAFPQAVTPQMVVNFLHGGAAVNVLARQSHARVRVVDAGVAGELPGHPDLLAGKIARGTKDFTQEPAMTRDQAVAALELGIRAVREEVARGLDLLACGDMGIGNTTPSAAIICAITGTTPRAIAGRGTGVDDTGLERKISAIERGLARHRPDPTDGLAVLTTVGGFEIGGIAGAMLAAGAARIPVVVDGFISTAAALIACTLAPNLKQFLIAGHRSQETGHALALAHLGLQPLLDINLRLGEGTGAVLAFHFIDAAARILGEMATFAEAGVSDKD
ncbi:MAG TPA: nicotinate-nucleotide--dimethylbenzimidazole phosphoribosyltransferase [bacterium]|nr:nicotinate-nucleotide--dimethylbenzimidazole phosphoribosyltransferase [bacterium]